MNKKNRTARRPATIQPDGFLREWLLLGPFSGDGRALLDRACIPETAVLPRTGLATNGRTWTAVATPQHRIDLTAQGDAWKAVSGCAYAHVYVHSPARTCAVLAIGSDDGAVIWLNGQCVFKLDAQRFVLNDEDRICVELHEGWNRLLLKVQQYTGGWGFCARFFAAENVPLAGLTCALDDPRNGQWPARADQTPHLAVYAGPRTHTAGAPPQVRFTLHNLSARRTPPAHLCATAPDAAACPAVPVPALEPGAQHVCDLRVPTARWAAAFTAPICLRVAAAGGPLSPTLELMPDVLSAFVAAAATPPPALNAAARRMLQRLRTDVHVVRDLTDVCPDAMLLFAHVTRALSAGDAPNAATYLAALDTVFNREAGRVHNQAVMLVGHAHIDMNWLWRWPETVQVCQDTFRQVIRFMHEFPDFRFTQSQAACYEAIEQHEPQLFHAIRRAVRRGAWNIVGGMWTESDTNLSSGEALARSFLLAQRYFAKKLGRRARVGWLPDCFGHPAQLPQLLRSAGIEYFYHMRTGPANAQLYWWEGPDGSRVLAKTGQGYNDRITPTIRTEPARLPAKIGAQLFVYGVGDHGGGPTRQDILAAKAYQTCRLFPTLRFATADDFFDHVKPRAHGLPVHHGELQYIFEGCYTTVATIKKGNRDLENMLQTAEAVATAALLTGRAWPAAPLTEAWQTLVFNEFHDILPGSAIHESNDDSRARYFLALNLATDVRNRALRAVAERVNIPEPEGIPLLVFNPLAWQRTEPVEAEIVVTEPFDTVQVFDPHGRPVAAQILRTKQFDTDLHVWLHFVAEAVPPVGYTTYRVRIITGTGSVKATTWGAPYPELVPLPLVTAPAPKTALARNASLRIANRFCEIECDQQTGVLRSLRPRHNGKLADNLLGPTGANRLTIYLEPPHGMSAWELAPTPQGPLALEPLGRTTIVQEGPASIALQSAYRWGRSSFWLTTTIYADSPRIDMHLRADWLEVGTATADAPMLRVEFALAGPAATLACDVPFAVVDRPAGREVPAQKWVDVAVGRGGVALLNNGKYGHSLHDGTLRLTLLRSSYDPDLFPDLGRHEIAWALLPHAGGWAAADVPRAGCGFNVPLLTYQARQQKGTLPQTHSFVATSGHPAFIVTGIKKAEDSRALIVRGYNASGTTITATISLDRAIRTAQRVNILEEKTKGAVRVVNGTARISVRPWEIVTLKCT